MRCKIMNSNPRIFQICLWFFSVLVIYFLSPKYFENNLKVMILIVFITGFFASLITFLCFEEHSITENSSH